MVFDFVFLCGWGKYLPGTDLVTGPGVTHFFSAKNVCVSFVSWPLTDAQLLLSQQETAMEDTETRGVAECVEASIYRNRFWRRRLLGIAFGPLC